MNPNHHQFHPQLQHLPPQFLNPPPTNFPTPSPNQNPNPNFQPSPPNLAATLSSLTDLIQLTEQTLATFPVSDLVLKARSNGEDDDMLAKCPFNPSHRMPARSLFSHYLSCPSTLDLNHVLSSLRYPHTLQCEKDDRFKPPGTDLDEELCLTVDGYGDFCANLFYKDCPGVVNLVSEQDSEKKVFRIPRVLFSECTDFLGSDGVEEVGRREFKLLVSEFWLGRCEVERWNDYAGSCSLMVLKMLLNVGAVKESEVKKWVIVNSGSYGIVIDTAMTDHITLLFQLCLRPIAKAAYRLVESVFVKGRTNETEESEFRSFGFDCKFLSEVLGWFVSQLVVLYGEVNGKYFGLHLLKHCIIEVGRCSLLFPVGLESSEPDTTVSDLSKLINHECVRKVADDDVGSIKDGEPELDRSLCYGIYLSQVGAAVAALHERSILERKIRRLRLPQQPKPHLVAEHDYLTKRAGEERQMRPNYRPVQEHDGLLWQHSNNQETNRTKTKEELLAEERDYKRRRMSYRGKKMKRSTTQVMRDIIEDYMEEIKQAGGIGCLGKGSEVGRVIPSEHPQSELPGVSDVEVCRYDSYEISRRQSDGHRMHRHLHGSRSGTLTNFSSKDYENQKSESYGHCGNFRNHERSRSRGRHDRDCLARSPIKGRNHGRSDDGSRERVDTVEQTRPRHNSMSADTASDRSGRSVSSSLNSMKEKYMSEDIIESKHLRRRDKNRQDLRIASDAIDDRYEPHFDDRYDPSH